MSETNIATDGTDSAPGIPPDLAEFAHDYGCYLKVHAEKERQTFNNSIDEMLTKLEEFGGLFDTIRSDTSCCLDKQVSDIETKCEEMKIIFTRIDQLEKFVAVVRGDVNTMEECVNKAESEMGTFSSFKKMFSSLVGGKKSNQGKDEKLDFVSPKIFATDEYLKPAPVDTTATECTENDTSTVTDPANTVSETT